MPEALEHYKDWKQADVKIFAKINELYLTPAKTRFPAGKPEPLKHQFKGLLEPQNKS